MSLDPAFKTWEATGQTLAQVEARIHDGVPAEKLRDRARGYLETIEKLFPESKPKAGGRMMEIGSGVGYVLQAAIDRWSPSSIVGLDVAAGMLEFAAQRLDRDGIDRANIELKHYDGVDFPYADGSFDFIYSVASLQHAPRAYCFRAICEAYRVLRKGGSACIHLLSYQHFENYMNPSKFREETLVQINRLKAHWHHYYSKSELEAVLQYGVGATDFGVVEVANSLYLHVSKS